MFHVRINNEICRYELANQFNLSISHLADLIWTSSKDSDNTAYHTIHILKDRAQSTFPKWFEDNFGPEGTTWKYKCNNKIIVTTEILVQFKLTWE